MKISVIGHFGEGKNLLNGQTIKTRIITEELIKQLGQDDVLKFDSHGGWKTLVKAPIQVVKSIKNADDIIIFPAHNGLRVYAPLLHALKRFFKNKRVHYVVIGGWLPQFLSTRKRLSKILKRFEGIYVETNTMKKALESMGFNNVYILPNCKNLSIISTDKLRFSTNAPHKLCTFSRVMKEKGIETAINAIKNVNSDLGYTAYTLDIYGQIDAGQVEWFEDLKKNFPFYVNYCGCVDSDKSVDVLYKYFALLFPTHFYTEGIPGTIIDAYAAGIPVISAKWESFSDIIEDGKTGLGYEFGDSSQLEKILYKIVQDPYIVCNMKSECLRKAIDYIPKTAISVMMQNFGN